MARTFIIGVGSSDAVNSTLIPAPGKFTHLVLAVRLFTQKNLESFLVHFDKFSMMKILVGMPSKDSWGGPVAAEVPFVEALKNLDVEVVDEVYVYGDKEKPTPFIERVRRVLKTAFRFRKVLKSRDFDIIHLNTAFDLKTILRDSVSLFLMNLKKTKVFLKLHGSTAEEFTDTNFLIRFLINYLKRKVDGFGIHTFEELENFKLLGFDEKKFHFVKNSIVIHKKLPLTFSRNIKSKNGDFEFLIASRFIPAKGVIETIRACSILKDRGLNFTLHCFGDGEIKKEVEDEIEKLGLQDRVRLPGYVPREELNKYFMDGDIFILPTRHAEGFPLALFDAVAVGIPIITTKVRSAAVYLKNEENCLFCTQEPEDIAEKMIQLIENESLRSTMSKNNISFGRELFPENIAKEFLDVYKAICKA